MCTITGAMLLVFDVMLKGSAVVLLAVAVGPWFVPLWWIVPLWLRLRRTSELEEEQPRSK